MDRATSYAVDDFLQVFQLLVVLIQRAVHAAVDCCRKKVEHGRSSWRVDELAGFELGADLQERISSQFFAVFFRRQGELLRYPTTDIRDIIQNIMPRFSRRNLLDIPPIFDRPGPYPIYTNAPKLARKTIVQRKANGAPFTIGGASERLKNPPVPRLAEDASTNIQIVPPLGVDWVGEGFAALGRNCPYDFGPENAHVPIGLEYRVATRYEPVEPIGLQLL